MKTIYKSILSVIIAAAGLTACSDYDAPDVTTSSAVTILSHETSFPAAASTGTITFKADGPVTVSSSSSWLTASVDGNTINLAVEQNNDLDGRAATLTIKCGNATDEISVLQSGLIFKFSDVSSSIDTDSDAKSFTYKADSSAPVKIESDAEWLSATLADGELTITVDRNKVLAPRTGSLTFTSGSLSSSVTVNQGALQCPLAKVTSISQNDDAKTYTYDFPTDIAVDFTAPDWIKASFANETITIVVEENNEGHIREGELTWTVDGTTGTVTITQHDFDKDIAGEYYFTFYDYFNDLEFNLFPAYLSQVESGYILQLIDTGVGNVPFTLPVDYDDETMTITLSSVSTSIGLFNKLYCFLMPVALDEDNELGVYFTRNQKMNASFEYTISSSGTAGTVASLRNDSANTLNLVGYSIGCFNDETTLNNSTFKGNLEIMVNPSLIRLHAATASAATSSTLEALNKTNAASVKVPFKNASSAKNVRRLAH